MAEHTQRLAAPPEPEFALRGHLAAVSSVRFVEGAGGEDLVVSGDTSGAAKLWSLRSRRPVASWTASDQGVVEACEHEDGASILTQTRDGRLRLWDVERLASGAAAADALTRTLRTDSFFFTRAAVARRSDCAFRYEAPVAAAPAAAAPAAAAEAADAEAAAAAAPPPPRAAAGIGAALDPADDAPAGDDAPPPEAAMHWSGRPGAPSHLVLAPTEPPEAMLLWDTRAPAPCAVLHPDAGDRTEVRPGGKGVLGLAMSAKLWLPYDGCGSGTPPLAIIGYEGGDVIAWDLAMMAPRPWARTPPGLFTSPLMGVDVNREGTVLFAGAVEAAARACALGPDVIRPRHGIALNVVCDAVHQMDRREGLGQVALRPDGRVLATAGWDFRVRLFSAKAPHFRPLAVLKYHDAAVNALDWTRDSRLLVTGSKDQKLAVWRLYPPRAP